MIGKLKNKFLNAPDVIQYAFLGAGLVLAYKTYKILFKDDVTRNNQAVQTQTQKELEEYLKTNKLSYPISQYSTWANTIYNSTMYGLGDNYGMVKTILLLMKNNADVSKLITAYGSRQNYVFGIPQGPPRDLLTNIRAELGDEYLGLYSGKLNDIRADWEKKKITYKL
jgi:hypothetical protein